MSCRGVLFAIDEYESTILKNCQNDDELVEYVQETIEQRWDEEWLCQLDKSWDAMHRCFANGELDPFGGKHPIVSVIFGGEILNKGDYYFVSLKKNALVKEIAGKINGIDKNTLKKLYEKITDDYQGEKNEEDFEYTWAYFEGVREFYLKVAQTDKDVIFTVDQ